MTPLLAVRGLTRTFASRDGTPTPALRATDLDVAEKAQRPSLVALLA